MITINRVLQTYWNHYLFIDEENYGWVHNWAFASFPYYCFYYCSLFHLRSVLAQSSDVLKVGFSEFDCTGDKANIDAPV
jgi:hypothetical protein